jgi:AcrR family transcriptional regulator
VTVAAILEDAGCSAPSLYHYWSSREGLLREACEAGWSEFRHSQATAAEVSADPLERVRARGREYLRFALERPGLFQVLFLTPPPLPPSKDPHPDTGLAQLISDVAAAMAAGQLTPRDPTQTAIVIWSTVHGLATLAHTNQMPDHIAFELLELSSQAVLDGLAAP